MPESENSYPVRSPIRHGGKRVTKGSVDLTEADAAPLLELGVIGPAVEPEPEKEPAAPKAPAKKPAAKKPAAKQS